MPGTSERWIDEMRLGAVRKTREVVAPQATQASTCRRPPLHSLSPITCTRIKYQSFSITAPAVLGWLAPATPRPLCSSRKRARRCNFVR
jgi:hypothetical protein